MAEDATVSFTIVHEGACQGRPDKHFELKRGAGNAVRIGRAPGNDVVVEFRGVSQYHAELRLEAVKGTLKLCVRDLGMNGTGLQKPDAKIPTTLVKQVDEPVPHDSQLLVPMMLKAAASPSDRALLRVKFDDPDAAGGVAAAEDGDGKANGAGSGDEQGEDEVEKNRMKFVDLLLKTKEVNASTTFEDAEALLKKDPAWTAVDEDTRKECFDIFVEHLGSHGKKKDKKGKKEKEKGKKKKDEDEKRSRKRSRSGSDAKGRRKGKKKEKGGSGSGSRSRSNDRRRKRRRGHSSD